MWLEWRLAGCVQLFLVGHLLLSLISIPSLWEVNLLAYALAWYAWVFVLGALLLFGFCFRPGAATVLMRLLPDPWRSGGWGWGGVGFFYRLAFRNTSARWWLSDVARIGDARRSHRQRAVGAMAGERLYASAP
jgi:hypothetical protein